MNEIFQKNNITLENCDCIERLKALADKSVDLVVTDIPYGEVNRDNNGLRSFDKGRADIVTFDLIQLCLELIRIVRGSIYIFCGTEQVSDIRKTFVGGGV